VESVAGAGAAGGGGARDEGALRRGSEGFSSGPHVGRRREKVEKRGKCLTGGGKAEYKPAGGKVPPGHKLGCR
jgi:hypothetical protein